ncbi:C1 family peptidase [Pedobacter sp. UC225_65]|uniref:C1 family peptidase n=1 Tax=Pedobacter sp. UC225_65 TaxID=3350173 RepID=UPI0036711F78
MRFRYFILLCLGFTALRTNAQQRSTGAIFNASTIEATPQKVTLSFRSFAAMPSSYSLEKYCPTPANQGNHGTCVAFANGYGIATILYAKTHNLTDKALINKYAFSPTFLYEQIKNANDKDCQSGADPITAIITMIKSGEALMRTVPYQCGVPLTSTAKAEAINYKIQDAAMLFAAKGMMKEDAYYKEPQDIINITKKALTEGTPVSGGFNIPESFFSIKSPIWTSDPAEVNKDWKHNGHAMAVVGYDDNVAGGAFRILNSWGNQWADGGYVWMKYNDFARYCVIALQVFADPNTLAPEENKPKPTPAPTPSPSPSPTPQPAPKPNEATFALSGSIEFKLNTGADMTVNKTSTRNLTVEEDVKGPKEDLVAYTMNGVYQSGTKFRFYMNIDQEAYVYAFATDLTGKVNLILPFADNISTHVGANSTIAFPSDSKVIQLDEQKGTDYLLILYAAQKLDAQAIATQMNSMQGALSTKIKTVLGNKLIDKSKITYNTDKVGFSTKGHSTRNLTVVDDSKPTTGSVVPLMVEIKHN